MPEYKVEVTLTCKGYVIVDAEDEDDAEVEASICDESDVSVDDNSYEIEVIRVEANE